MDSKFVEKLMQIYIKNPLEGITAKLIKNMTNSDLLDITSSPRMLTLIVTNLKKVCNIF